VQALPEPVQRVLAVAAVAGSRVDHELLAAVVGQDAERLVGWLREAVGHHVMAVEEASGGYVFRHALVQEAVYDDLLPVQRGPLHAAYARALGERVEQRGEGGGASAVELGQLAYHWYAAHDLGQALPASVRAGQAAESASALAEALEHYQRALELWDQVPEAAARSPFDRVTLLQRAGEVASLAGDVDHAIALVSLALEAVDPSAEALRAGALLERLARYQWLATDTPRAMATIDRALATIPAEPPSPELARALAAHGQLLMLLCRHSKVPPRCEAAIAVARRVGDRAVEGHALTTLGTSLGVLGHLETAVAHLERGRRIAAELGDVDDLLRVHSNLGKILGFDGRTADAIEVYLAGAALARQAGAMLSYGVALLPWAAGDLASLGRWDEAQRLLDEVFDLDLSSPVHRLMPLIYRAGCGCSRATWPPRRPTSAGSWTTGRRGWTRSTPHRCSPASPRRPCGAAVWPRRVPPRPRRWRCWPAARNPTSCWSCAVPAWPWRRRRPSGPATAAPAPSRRQRGSGPAG
jgi:tetratricopeptide (TPR) repeat protein